jgi:UDP-GlcNAc:undecaprenyl-phosphate GlcNAc-1-phosphate transferase
MTESIIPYSFSLALTYILTRLLVPLAPKFGLMDIPTNRKKHVGDIPVVGGLAVYISIFISTMLFTELQLEILSIITLGGILTTIGTLDDKYGLSPRLRLVIQLCAGGLLAYGAGIQIHSLGNVFGGLFGLSVILTGLLAVPLTAIGIAALANAYNMTDGIDGLAAALGIVGFSALIISLYDQLTPSELNVLCFYALSLTTYLLFNFAIKPLAPVKVFMGDAGSMFIGFSIGAFCIYFSQKAGYELAPTTVLWFVAVPLYDMIATMIRRIRKGQSPFYPDRTHLHHLLMHLGLNGKQALAAIVLFAITLGGIGVLIDHYQVADYYSFIGFMLIFIAYLQVILHAWRVKKLFGQF